MGMPAAGNPDVSTVSCPCGATMEVDLSSGDDVLFCPDCRETLQLSVTVDPVTKKKRVGVVLSMGALLSQKGRKGETKVGSVPAAGDVYKAKCTCGAMIFVDPQAVDRVHSCGKCGAGFSAVLKRGRTPGLSMLVLRPVDTAPVTKAKPAAAPAAAPAGRPAPAAPPKTAPPKAAAAPPKAPAARPASAPPAAPAGRPAAAPPPKPPVSRPAPPKPAPPAAAPPAKPRPAAAVPAPVAKAQAAAAPKVAPLPKPAPKTPAPAALDAAATPAREQLLTIHKGDIGAQPIQVKEEGSFISCFCGKEIRLKGEANREVHKCAECGASYRLFYAIDPRSKTPMVVMLPRAASK